MVSAEDSSRCFEDVIGDQEKLAEGKLIFSVTKTF
jgi:hypothetical protein